MWWTWPAPRRRPKWLKIWSVWRSWRRKLHGGHISRPLVLAVIALVASSSSAQVVVNEVLYDPEGPDTGKEFLELLNCGRVGVSLAGWTIETGNGANTDDWTVEWIGGDFDYLEPGEILLVGESDVQPEPAFVTALDLQNGPDGVRITDGSSVVDLVGWGEPLFQEYYEGAPAEDVPSGSSLVRSPDCYDHDNNRLDFVASDVPTPGSQNAPEVDLSIEALHLGPTVLPESETVRLHFRVGNTGSLAVGQGVASVVLYPDGTGGPHEEIAIAEALDPRDTVAVSVEMPASPGYHQVTARVDAPGDGEPANDLAETSFTVGRPGGLIKLNEVMFSPSEGTTEWVEFENATAESVDVSGWALGDDVDQNAIVTAEGGRLFVSPGGYLVAARDTSGLSRAFSCAVVETGTWEALSAEDTVLLLDAFGTPIERVSYDDAWGGERGISLERVRTDVAPDLATNWGSSVDPSGSTPCATNSIFLPAPDVRGHLTALPNPFTPNADGDGDRTILSYALPTARATLRLSIYDVRGRRRARLLDHAASASRGEIIWDGTDESGAPLPSGMYVVRLEAISPREGILVDEKLAVGLLR